MPTEHLKYVDISRRSWGKSHDSEKPIGETFGTEEIRTGALLRIATALELQAELMGQHLRALQRVDRRLAKHMPLKGRRAS